MLKNCFEKIRILSFGEAKRTDAGSGVLIERRKVLWLPVAAAALLLPGRLLANEAPVRGPLEGLDWKDFLEEVSPNARELHKDTSARGQDSYLFWLASMAARINFGSVPKGNLKLFANLDPPVETGLAHRGIPFFVIEWRMSPNAYLPPHNHPNISVCTLCIEGEATMRNFNLQGEAPDFSSKDEFWVRETHNEILTPGRINTLSAVRDNIHTFKAGRGGARGIDITTYHGSDEGFSFLDIEERPFDSERRIYKAVWKKS